VNEGVELIQIEESQRGALDAARRRVTPLVHLWASYPAIWGLDLYWLAVSCYMQGTVDGYDVAERHLRSEAKQ
jgi:hypothetical protein